jgi:hypothetical protein
MKDQLKPVIVKTLIGSSVEDVRVFDTLKLAYAEFAGDLTYQDYHCFRGALCPHLKGKKPYNVVLLKRLQDKMRVNGVEFITADDAHALFDEAQVNALAEKNFFEPRGVYGHLIKNAKPKPSATLLAEANAVVADFPAVAAAIDVEANKASAKAVYKAISKVYHGSRVKLENIRNRFHAGTLGVLPEASEAIREIAFQQWAKDGELTAEQKELIGE